MVCDVSMAEIEPFLCNACSFHVHYTSGQLLRSCLAMIDSYCMCPISQTIQALPQHSLPKVDGI